VLLQGITETAETGILCELFRNVCWLFLVILESYPDERPGGAYHRIDSNNAPLLDIRDSRNCEQGFENVAQAVVRLLGNAKLFGAFITSGDLFCVLKSHHVKVISQPCEAGILSSGTEFLKYVRMGFSD
jgi:hypothetical protein